MQEHDDRELPLAGWPYRGTLCTADVADDGSSALLVVELDADVTGAWPL